MDKFTSHDELEQSLLEQGASPIEVTEIFDTLIYYYKKTNFVYFDKEKGVYKYRPVVIEKFEDTSGWFEVFETTANSLGKESSVLRLFANYLLTKLKYGQNDLQEELFQFANYRNRLVDMENLYWCFCRETGRFIFVHVEK